MLRPPDVFESRVQNWQSLQAHFDLLLRSSGIVVYIIARWANILAEVMSEEVRLAILSYFPDQLGIAFWDSFSY